MSSAHYPYEFRENRWRKHELDVLEVQVYRPLERVDPLFSGAFGIQRRHTRVFDRKDYVQSEIRRLRDVLSQVRALLGVNTERAIAATQSVHVSLRQRLRESSVVHELLAAHTEIQHAVTTLSVQYRIDGLQVIARIPDQVMRQAFPTRQLAAQYFRNLFLTHVNDIILPSRDSVLLGQPVVDRAALLRIFTNRFQTAYDHELSRIYR